MELDNYYLSFRADCLSVFFACISIYYRGDVVQVDTWVAASGKNGMRRDWLLRDYNTGEILTRASRLELVLFKPFNPVHILTSHDFINDHLYILQVNRTLYAYNFSRRNINLFND